MTLDIHFLQQDARWRVALKGEWDFMRKILRTAIMEIPNVPPGEYEVAIALADDAAIRTLNRDFRNKDAATNVLSFPQYDDVAAMMPPASLGDIMLAFETMQREAMEQKKSLRDHTAHLLLHGFLHLFGYDHMTEREAQEMEALETKILAAHGVADPYR